MGFEAVGRGPGFQVANAPSVEVGFAAIFLPHPEPDVIRDPKRCGVDDCNAFHTKASPFCFFHSKARGGDDGVDA